MIGASVVNGSEVVPFIVAQADAEKAKFVVVDEDLNYLGAGPYYLVYPYDKDAQVGGSATAPTVDLTIPASQRYRSNSFATMTVPAVGKIDGDYRVDPDATEDKEAIEDVEVTMYPATSFIRVPVLGVGTLSKLKLQILKSDGRNYNVLNGTKTVSLKDVSNAAIDLTKEGVSSGTNDYVEINFGQTGKKLSLTEADTLYFVVPANIVLSEATLEFTPTIDGKEAAKVEYTAPKLSAEYATLKRNTIQPIKAIMLGTENMVMINNTEDFLKYAYEVNLETASADADYISDGKFKTAVLLESISFRNYDAGQKYSDNAALGADKDAILEAALQAYMTNGGFSSLKAGANIDGNGNTISYMTVNGNGIFAGQPDALKNLTLSAVTVNVPDEANPALFVGNINLYSCSEGLAIRGGYLKNVAEDATAALIHTAYIHTLPLKGQVTISYPRVNESSGAPAYYASKLTLRDDVDASGDLKAYFNSATPRFGAIVVDGQDVAIRNVSSAYVKGLLDVIQYGGGSKAISVIDSKGTSYWTGGVASEAPANGEVKTAEQLAYYVKNGGTATLAANINLQGNLQGKQGKEWVLDNGNAPLNITGNGKYTISNALVKSQKVTEPYVAYSLLGNVVNAKDIVVDGVTIDVDNVEGSTAQLYVGGIGYQGSANGVKVSNLTIDIAEDVKVSTYNEVGGLISAPKAASEKNVVTALSININGNETVGLVGGMFAKAPASFNGNVLTWGEGATGAMIGAWTVTDDFAGDTAVENCNAGEAPIVDILTVDAANGGQTLVLEFNNCSEKIYNEIVNPNTYTTTIKLNGVLQEIAPSK